MYDAARSNWPWGSAATGTPPMYRRPATNLLARSRFQRTRPSSAATSWNAFRKRSGVALLSLMNVPRSRPVGPVW